MTKFGARCTGLPKSRRLIGAHKTFWFCLDIQRTIHVKEKGSPGVFLALNRVPNYELVVLAACFDDLKVSGSCLPWGYMRSSCPSMAHICLVTVRRSLFMWLCDKPHEKSRVPGAAQTSGRASLWHCPHTSFELIVCKLCHVAVIDKVKE